MAVAGTFAAITEDWRYRKGMKDEQALRVMADMTADGALDGNVFGVLRESFDEIQGIRRAAQFAYAIKQSRLAEVMGQAA